MFCFELIRPCVKLRVIFIYYLLEEKSLPTDIQAKISVFVCQMLSNAFQPINVFRYDRKLETLYIQAGVDDNLGIIIDKDGEWEFV